MRFLAASAGSYPRIGDRPADQVLRRTIDAWEKQKKTDRDLAEAQNEMTRRAVDEQVEAGLDVLTDGQIRWNDPISHLLRGAANVRISGLLRLFDTNFYFRQPIVSGPVKWSRPVLAEEYRFAASHSGRAVKPVLTGPFTLAKHSKVANGARDLLTELAEFVAAEVAALAESGARTIQIDEPSILRDPASFDAFARAVRTVTSRKGSAEILLATYWGDAAPLLDRLLALPVDGLAFDVTYSPRLADALASAEFGGLLQLGLVDGRNTRREDPSEVAKVAERMSRRARGTVAIAPSCGLEHLPRDRAFEKLRVTAEAKRILASSAAVR